MIKGEKFIKESRKWKRNTLHPQNKAFLTLKIVKASSLLNDNIFKTLFNASKKTAKVVRESNKTLRELYEYY